MPSQPFRHEEARLKENGDQVNTLSIGDLTTTPTEAPGSANANLPIEFGRYRLLKKLGEGGMGAVFLAHDSELDRRVALKLPHFTGVEKAAFLERFRREAKLAAKLDHPNICRVFDIGEHNGRLYLTMAFVEGKSLYEIVKARGAIEPRTACQLIKRIATAVQFAHSQGIIHRDLKPANIMIKKDRDFVIMDFGLARLIDHDDAPLTATGAVLGTPAYMSPEQLLGENEKIGPPSDVYSLGIMLFELLVGRRPFQGSVTQIYAQILSTQPALPSTVREEIDSDLDKIFYDATRRECEHRFQSANDLAQALDSYLRTAPNSKSAVVAADAASDRSHAGNIDLDRLLSEPRNGRPLVHMPKSKPKSSSVAGRYRNYIGVGVVMLTIAILIAWLGGILTVNTPDGTIIIEGMPADGEATVDGKKVTVTWNQNENRAEISIEPGEHRLNIFVEGILVQGEKVTIRPNEATSLTVRYAPPESTAISSSPNQNVSHEGLSVDAPQTSVSLVETPFEAGSVWTDTEGNLKLVVLSRTGESFEARFNVGDRIERLVAGTVKGNEVSWLARNVTRVSGTAGADNFGKLVRDESGDRIEFRWQDESQNSGVFELRKQKTDTLQIANEITILGTGNWSIEEFESEQTLLQHDVFRGLSSILFGDPSWSEYDIYVRARTEGGSQGFNVIFHQNTNGDYVGLAFGSYGNTGHDLATVVNDKWSRDNKYFQAVDDKAKIKQNEWYDIKIKVRGAKSQSYLNGKLLFDAVYATPARGRVGLSTWDSKACFKEILVTAPDNKDIVLWQGLPDPKLAPGSRN